MWSTDPGQLISTHWQRPLLRAWKDPRHTAARARVRGPRHGADVSAERDTGPTSQASTTTSSPHTRRYRVQDGQPAPRALPSPPARWAEHGFGAHWHLPASWWPNARCAHTSRRQEGEGGYRLRHGSTRSSNAAWYVSQKSSAHCSASAGRDFEGTSCRVSRFSSGQPLQLTRRRGSQRRPSQLLRRMAATIGCRRQTVCGVAKGL
jgi:hypothetical protein